MTPVYTLILDGLLDLPTWLHTAVAGLLVIIIFARFCIPSPSPYSPVNYDKSSWTYGEAKRIFQHNARQLLIMGATRDRGPFSIITDDGPIIVLSPDHVEDVNQEPHLSLEALAQDSFLAKYNTFRIFGERPQGLLHDAVLRGLTRNLAKQINPVSMKMAICLESTWGESKDWHNIKLQDDILTWVARLSTLVFHGPELSENAEWLRISVDYTVNCVKGVRICRAIPVPFRWLAEGMLPICRRIRRDYRKAAGILRPISTQRHSEINTARREQREPNLPDDSLEWFRNAAKGRPYNEIDTQLRLSAVAIHTSSDLLQQAVLNLCAHPELFRPLRDEIRDVLRRLGWTKAALVELCLMDSFLKETQRLKPIGITFMHRIATAQVRLADDICVSRGSKIAISSHRMWSPQIYENPEIFDAYRYIKLRGDTAWTTKSRLVATSKDHTAFGYGKHACPGRFFAATEIKIALMHILLKYDVELEDSKMAQPVVCGFNLSSNPEARIRVRRREN